MEDLRRIHNNVKRFLIKNVCRKGDRVLDVGCGRGGDLHKWKTCKVKLWGVDPDTASIEEAKTRAVGLSYNAELSVGDVTTAPVGPFDIVCYNFSLQYIFASLELLNNSITEIRNRVRVGGVLIGVVPDSEKILSLPCKWTDSLGNTIERGPSIGKGSYFAGQMILVKLSDGPYYANGAIPEPLCHKGILFQKLYDVGFELVSWDDMLPKTTGLVSDIYSQFIFTRIR